MGFIFNNWKNANGKFLFNSYLVIFLYTEKGENVSKKVSFDS